MVLLLKASGNFVNHWNHFLQITTKNFDDKIILREKKKVVSEDEELVSYLTNTLLILVKKRNI